MNKTNKKLDRQKRKEVETHREWCQEQRKNYKHGHLTLTQQEQLQQIEGWYWSTPDYIDIHVFRTYINGVTEEVSLIKCKPYGMINEYKIKFQVDIGKVNGELRKESVIMIVKNQHIKEVFACSQKCPHHQCDCDEMIYTVCLTEF
jgi:hypothetical protein